MTGQDAVRQAQTFGAQLKLTGVILTKLDGDARGGAALSVASVTNVPIRFAGTGEKPSDFEPFHPDRMASRILGMGDVLTLVEKAQEAFDAKKAAELERKLAKEGFDLEDFLEQLRELRKGGLFAAMMDLLPGVKKLKAQASPDERQLKRMEAIICSMTREERRRPEIINGSRRRRIARGAGTSVEEVNRLLRQWAQTKKLMRSMQGKDPRRVLRGLGL
ncbi:MAG: signal recognition particle protein, partial [Thermoanaerobaculum sp.]